MKRPWIAYVSEFMNTHEEIPIEMFGRWKEVIEKEYGQQQRVSIPTRDDQLDSVTKALHELRSSGAETEERHDAQENEGENWATNGKPDQN